MREKTPEKETDPLKLGTFNDSGYEQEAKNLSQKPEEQQKNNRAFTHIKGM